MIVVNEKSLQKAIEEEWAWRGKYLAPSSLKNEETKLWVIELELSHDIRHKIEQDELHLGKHTTKGLQHGRADLRDKVKVETRGPFKGYSD